ncbi:hypothetical protein DBV15_09986 [Temnothorax longispinosus]|uniref:Endonuclease/exonuclease/phosphatase domain-containing protein n=1 Tax=Temnothorax longispinosus TaxID=300112 RepID=A0A4V3S7P0_9HYME|nr:hypothetical protein DBV15_09986 [Temnothorax longispinosus]
MGKKKQKSRKDNNGGEDLDFVPPPESTVSKDARSLAANTNVCNVNNAMDIDPPRGQKRSADTKGMTEDRIKIPCDTRNIPAKDSDAGQLGSGGTPPAASTPLPSEPSKVTNRYRVTDEKPFIVHFQHVQTNVSLHSLQISRMISASFKKDIVECKQVGNNKVMVTFSTAKAANSVIDHPLLKQKNLTAFIPSFRVMRVGIVRDIPIEFALSELETEFESSAKISSISRMNRKIRENDGTFKFVPSKTVMLKFESQKLPKEVALFKTKIPVAPYIPRVLICFSCYRFGHVGANCKGNPRCIRCAQVKHKVDEVCPRQELPPVCGNCGAEHLPTSPSCPALGKQKQIYNIAYGENIPLPQARARVEGGDPRQLISYRSLEDYPQLPSQSRGQSQSLNSNSYANCNTYEFLTNASGASCVNSHGGTYSEALRSHRDNTNFKNRHNTRVFTQNQNREGEQEKMKRDQLYSQKQQAFRDLHNSMLYAPNAYAPGCGILYWNCRGAVSKKPEIEKLCEDYEVIFLAETCMTPANDFSIRGFKVLRRDSFDPGVRGMLALVKETILFSQIDLAGLLDPSVEAIGLELKIASVRTIVVGVYRHPKPFVQNTWRDLFSLVGSREYFLLMGDINAHHPYWGATRVNSAGSCIVDILDQYPLKLINADLPTYIPPPGITPSLLDLTICSSNLAPLCESLTLRDTMGSDYRPIIVHVNRQVRSVKVFSYKHKLSKEQWRSFTSILQSRAEDLEAEVLGISDKEPLQQYRVFFYQVDNVLNMGDMAVYIRDGASKSVKKGVTLYKTLYKQQKGTKLHQNQ